MLAQRLVGAFHQLYFRKTSLITNEINGLLRCSLISRTFCAALQKNDTSIISQNNTVDYHHVLDTVKTDYTKDFLDKKLFAVVYIGGAQFKIALHDIIMINKKIEADCGELIRFEKVLLAGGKNFTLIGQPILKREIVEIQGMVVEKTKGEKKIVFKKKRRKGYKKWKGARQDLSVIKITDISFNLNQV